MSKRQYRQYPLSQAPQPPHQKEIPTEFSSKITIFLLFPQIKIENQRLLRHLHPRLHHLHLTERDPLPHCQNLIRTAVVMEETTLIPFFMSNACQTKQKAVLIEVKRLFQMLYKVRCLESRVCSLSHRCCLRQSQYHPGIPSILMALTRRMLFCMVSIARGQLALKYHQRLLSFGILRK